MRRTVLLSAVVAAILTAPAPARAATAYTLLTQPASGHTALHNLINNATTSINLTMYELTDTTATADLAGPSPAASPSG